MTNPSKKNEKIVAAYQQFAAEFEPLEWVDEPKRLRVMTDRKSGTRFCDCHIRANKLIPLGTTDVPLDSEYPEYRANRELVANHPASR
jgi:hypothetical protein